MNPEVAYAGLLETSAAVGQLVLIAILLERALAFVFEYHWFAALSKKVEGLKAPIAFLLALLIARQTRFDILGEMFRAEGEPVVVTWIGSMLTAAIIAGGSAGAMALFQTWFNWNRDARKNKQAARTTEESAKLKEAQAREKFAEADLALAATKLAAHSDNL